MTDSAQRGARTVPDDLAIPWARMVRKQRALNQAQEARLMSNASLPAKRAETAKQASNVVSGAEIAAATGAAVTQHNDDLLGAKALKRFTGPVGKGLDAIPAEEGFRANLKRGVPLDEALIRHGGGFGLGLLGGAAGTAGGAVAGGAAGTFLGGPAGAAPGALAGGAIGGKLGSDAGEQIAGTAADSWKAGKQRAREITRITLDGVARVNRPGAWVGRGRLGAFDGS